MTHRAKRVQRSIPQWLILLLLLVPTGTRAQPLEWELRAGSQPVPWPGKKSWPADSVRMAALDALAMLQSEGFLLARVDSHHTGTDRATLYVSPGAAATIESIRVEGTEGTSEPHLTAVLSSEPGAILSAHAMADDAERLLSALARQGHLLARVVVGPLKILHTDPPRVGLSFIVHRGPLTPLADVVLRGAQRTRPGFVRRIARLDQNRAPGSFDPYAAREALIDSDVFSFVGAPALAVRADSAAILQIPVTEAPPGAFDLAMGYERDGTGKGALAGSGRLMLRNLFGHGRTISVQLNRAPGQLSTASVRGHDPYLLGLPLSMAATFDGLQQDSVYGKRDYGLELGFRPERRTQIFGTLLREVTRPGLTGVRLEAGRQRIPVAKALFAGLGVRLYTTDNRINPQRGIVFESTIESGRKDRTMRVVHADTTEERSRLQQSRLKVKTRVFLPATPRMVLALGAETKLLRSRELDESDLFRFGGARTLRGYDEQRFRAPFTARLFAEYRYLLDAASRGMIFIDVGYVDASRTQAALRGFYPGFGAGFQLDTDAGLVSITVAASTEEPTAPRVHLGYSIGL